MIFDLGLGRINEMAVAPGAGHSAMILRQHGQVI